MQDKKLEKVIEKIDASNDSQMNSLLDRMAALYSRDDMLDIYEALKASVNRPEASLSDISRKCRIADNITKILYANDLISLSDWAIKANKYDDFSGLVSFVQNMVEGRSEKDKIYTLNYLINGPKTYSISELTPEYNLDKQDYYSVTCARQVIALQLADRLEQSPDSVISNEASRLRYKAFGMDIDEMCHPQDEFAPELE